MSQAELADFGKFVLVCFGYFIGVRLSGVIVTECDSDNVLIAGWLIGGLAFATLALFV